MDGVRIYNITRADKYIFNSEKKNFLLTSLFLINKIRLNIDKEPRKTIALILITRFKPNKNPKIYSLGIVEKILLLLSK